MHKPNFAIVVIAAGAATTGMETNTGHEIQQSGSGPSAAIVDNSPFHGEDLGENNGPSISLSDALDTSVPEQTVSLGCTILSIWYGIVLADPNVTFQQAKSGNGETVDVVGEQNKHHEPGGPVDGTPSELLTLATVIDEAVTDVRTDAITVSLNGLECMFHYCGVTSGCCSITSVVRWDIKLGPHTIL